MQRKIFVMFAMFVVSIAVVLVLFIKAGPADAVGNGFSRTFHRSKQLVPMDTLDLVYNSFYMAGKAKSHLYFANVVSPGYLLAVDIGTLDSQRVRLQLPDAIWKGYWSIRVRVDSPDYYLSDGAVPFIYRARLEGGSGDRLLEQRAYFLDLLPLDSGSFAVRSISPSREGRLGKLTVKPFALRFPSGLLERQVDGLLCTDGMMHYDRASRQLVYLYRYRNEFLVMDTDLSLQYKGTTVDTNTVAKIEVATVASSNSITFSKPPLVVNKESCLNGQRLYVLSSLRADNEQVSEFHDVSVVDVYDLRECRYAFSFYIPDYDGEKVSHFEAFERKLIAEYDDKIISYALPP